MTTSGFQVETPQPNYTYELELCKMWFDGDAKDGDLIRMTEETKGSGTIEELKELAKTIKRKGNRSYREELRIIELDEHGDILDYVWSSG